MEILLDTANISEIKRLSNIVVIDGVTTNPTILSREQRDYKEVLNELKEFLKTEQSLHIQVVSTTVEEIINESKAINAFRDNTYAKIPCTIDGLEAMKKLKEEGYLVTATAVYSISQGVLAAKAGVDYIAPYLNRLDNMGFDGVGLISDLVTILRQEGYKTKVVAASFKNTQQVLEMMKHQCPAMTLSPDVLQSMMTQPMTTDAVNTFSHDWQKRFNESNLNLE